MTFMGVTCARPSSDNPVTSTELGLVCPSGSDHNWGEMFRLVMDPGAGERVARFVGDRLRVTVRTEPGAPLPEGWRVLLRTNLGRGKTLRQEIIHSYPAKPPLAGAAWHDLPLFPQDREWQREITLTEPGFFQAKAYAVDPRSRQHWAEGPDLGVSIHPDSCRTGNIIYCAFARMFGQSKAAASTQEPEREDLLKELDAQHFTVIPPSGKLRDLVRQLPHIFGALKCRILQLLPVTPTPTVYARFGRYGSPYAVQDLTAVDPALVEFDRRTTGLDQFHELTHEAHRWGGRVFLDIPINHTGWGARLQERHPEWYLRNERGEFVSPGAWGVTWEDLVELNHGYPELWEDLAAVFLTWCRRGVDGFRCDAGYKIPVPAWRYITARVQDEFPETVFLLEGLGGSWEATEALLTDGGMQWAYSELFQNYTGGEVARYLDYSLRQSGRVGLYVHYSETHDNDRLAAKGRAWSLLRNRLCGLTSVSGGFGFTCGVEWLAPEKVNVHAARGLRWGHPNNIVPELARLHELLLEHPCFRDGTTLTRVSRPDSVVHALHRKAAGTADSVLVLVNTDPTREQKIALDPAVLHPFALPASGEDLLEQPIPAWRRLAGGEVEFTMPPAAVCCLEIAKAGTTSSPSSDKPTAGQTSPGNKQGHSSYAQARARAAWAVTALCERMPAEEIGRFDWVWLAKWVEQDPVRFLGALAGLGEVGAQTDLRLVLERRAGEHPYPQVVTWRVSDSTRVVSVPPGHWVALLDSGPFRATLTLGESWVRHARSIPVQDGHVACFAPLTGVGDARLELEFYAGGTPRVVAGLRYLDLPGTTEPVSGIAAPAPTPHGAPVTLASAASAHRPGLPAATGDSPWLALLTNGRGGMARLSVDLGRICSKYDCLLGANLDPLVPVDRHIFAKRLRAWVLADGFITPLSGDNLVGFEAGPPAVWHFLANAGDGRAVEIKLTAWMLAERNSVCLRFHRPDFPPALGRELPKECQVSLTVRVDIEDRNFHFETHRNGGTEHHFATHCHPLPQSTAEAGTGALGTSGPVGFVFSPAADRQLRVLCGRGVYHHEAEWCEHISHPIEASRGMVAEGDAYSPGWFEIPLCKEDSATLVVTAEKDEIPGVEGKVLSEAARSVPVCPRVEERGGDDAAPSTDPFEDRLEAAARTFVVRRGKARTVIAGYPWFLDWGRDTLISARGLLAAGLREEVAQLLAVFGRFEDRGTLPNALYGDDASNRDTSDAPLWYGVLAQEWSGGPGHAGLLSSPVGAQGKTIAEVLRSIATHYIRGTLNGIRMDPESGLIWSPSHFTWMDTNHPAGSPREGYPVEIQVLWIRLLRQMEELGLPSPEPGWKALAERAAASLEERFWLERSGWLSDVLQAGPGTPARAAVPTNCFRPNCLFAVSFGLLTGERARRLVTAAQRYLLVPGALRSLAPLPVTPPLPIYARDGRLLNDPEKPYWGRYEGDEDTRRKPAYHNGTAWTWLLPTFCEALARAWDFQPTAVAAGRTYLRGLTRLMEEGCLGHIPEIVDGDAPHQARGCDAQAWSATEALRVWKQLSIRAREISGPPS
jgi:starch synthase (maltosyl-transferring)